MIYVQSRQVPRPDVTLPDRLTAHRASLNALTGIRFFAALYVVIYHSRLPEALAAAHLPHAGYFIANGYLAVLLFFLLSGFILSYTYKGQIETRSEVRRFWEARFARIWPLYALSLVLSTLALHNTPSLPRALATIFMVQAWDPADVDLAGTWNFVCWTLSTEALFYLLFPFLQNWLEHRKERLQVALMLLMMAIAVAFNTGCHVFGYPTAGVYAHLPLALVHVPEFIIGICLGNLFLERQASLRAGNVATPSPMRLVPLGSGIVTWLAALASLALLSQREGRLVSLSAVSFAVLLYGLAAERSLPQRILSSRLLLIGGQISYGMYLLQWPCKTEINLLCDRFHMGSLALHFFLNLIALLTLSTAGFYLVEDPSRKLIRRFFARAEQARGGAARQPV